MKKIGFGISLLDLTDKGKKLFKILNDNFKIFAAHNHDGEDSPPVKSTKIVISDWEKDRSGNIVSIVDIGRFIDEASISFYSCYVNKNNVLPLTRKYLKYRAVSTTKIMVFDEDTTDILVVVR